MLEYLKTQGLGRAMQVRLMILLVKLRGGGRTFKKFDISTIILVFTMLIEYKFVKTANLTLYAWY